MLWDALREDISRRVGTEATRRLFSYLQGRLLKDGGVFLLDGLDEVPEAERRREVLLGAIRALVATLPDAARLLVTARPYAYADKKWHLPALQSIAGVLGSADKAAGAAEGLIEKGAALAATLGALAARLF